MATSSAVVFNSLATGERPSGCQPRLRSPREQSSMDGHDPEYSCNWTKCGISGAPGFGPGLQWGGGRQQCVSLAVSMQGKLIAIPALHSWASHMHVRRDSCLATKP